MLGDGVLDVYDLVLHRDAPFPSIADALYLLGYPFLFAGVFRISRARGARDSREARADAAIVCIGALALSWQFLMHSYAHDSTVDWFGKLVTMAYPMMDLGVVFIVVSALLYGVARRSTDKLIIAAITAMLIGDFIYDVLVLRGAYTVGNPIDAAFLVNYVLIAAAALHPSMAQPLRRHGWTTDGRTRWPATLDAAGRNRGLCFTGHPACRQHHRRGGRCPGAGRNIYRVVRTDRRPVLMAVQPHPSADAPAGRARRVAAGRSRYSTRSARESDVSGIP